MVTKDLIYTVTLATTDTPDGSQWVQYNFKRQFSALSPALKAEDEKVKNVSCLSGTKLLKHFEGNCTVLPK